MCSAVIRIDNPAVSPSALSLLNGNAEQEENSE